MHSIIYYNKKKKFEDKLNTFIKGKPLSEKKYLKEIHFKDKKEVWTCAVKMILQVASIMIIFKIMGSI